MLTDKFRLLLDFIKDKKILITSHDLLDIDGLVSCYALKYFINHYLENQQVTIFFSDLLRSTKEFMQKFSEKFHNFYFEYEKSIRLSNFNVCLILDTNKTSQTSLDQNFKNSKLKIPYIFIDHHYTEKKKSYDSLNPLNLIFDNFSSTAEIVLELFMIYNLKLSLPLRFLIISGILTDTGYFRYASNKTIKNVSKLLDDDLNIQEVKLVLKKKVDISEKIAKIKGLQRIKLYREGDYLIGITNVSSYGSNVASMLLKIGCDIGIVHSKDKLESVITIRAKKNICLKTGLHLGKILEEISEYCGGNGGGHNGAAALTYKIEAKPILDKIIEKIKQVLNN